MSTAMQILEQLHARGEIGEAELRRRRMALQSLQKSMRGRRARPQSDALARLGFRNLELALIMFLATGVAWMAFSALARGKAWSPDAIDLAILGAMAVTGLAFAARGASQYLASIRPRRR
jgi:hypothetical protein